MIDGYSKQEILKKLKDICDSSRSFVQNKRTDIKNNYKSFHNEGDIDKVYDRTIKTMTKIIKSIHAKQKLEVDTIVEGYDESGEAKMIKGLFKSDFELNKRARKNKIKIENMCIGGAGIELQTWNWATQRADYIVVHPLTWLPDTSYDANYGYKYHAFELEIGKDEIAYGGFVNVGELKTKADKKIEKIIEEKLKTSKNVDIDEINTIRSGMSFAEKNTYAVILHYVRFDGVPYEIRTDADHQTIIGLREIVGVTTAQKKNPYLIEYPVTVSYLLENPHDVFGDNLFTIIGDDQKMRQLFLNWGVQIARDNAGLGIYAVVEDAIKNPEDAINPDPNNRTYLKIDPKYASFASGVIRPLNDQKATPQDIYNQTQVMQQEMYYKAGYDESSAGVIQGSTTATQQIRAQKNANLITQFNETYVSDGEVDFWQKRLEIYARFGEKKIKFRLAINNIYQKSDFTPGRIRQMLTKIIIRPMSLVEQEREAKKQFYLVNGQFLYQTATSKATKYKIQYNMCKAEGLDDYEIEDILDEPIELIRAKMDLELLNQGIQPEIIDETEDHRVYLSEFRKAKEGLQKEIAIAKRLALLAQYGAPEEQVQTPTGTGNIARNLEVANRVSQQDAPSLQDTRNNG